MQNTKCITKYIILFNINVIIYDNMYNITNMLHKHIKITYHKNDTYK